MDCPYHALEGANLVLCEANRCGWIAQPAATWSNIGFLIVAAAIWRWSRRDGSPAARWFAPIAFATGIGSIAFHATSTLVGQLVDQSIMFLETALFIVLDLRRLGIRAGVIGYIAIVVASVALVLVFPTMGIALFIGHVAAFTAFEIAVIAKRPRPTQKHLVIAVGVFALSYGLWWLDAGHVLCDPENHIFTGHAAWHLLGALSFAFWYRHFAQDATS